MDRGAYDPGRPQGLKCIHTRSLGVARAYSRTPESPRLAAVRLAYARESVAAQEGPGFGARRVFLPPVWPPPRLIVFCLVHCMRCTAAVPLAPPPSADVVILLLHRLLQLSFLPQPLSAWLHHNAPRPLHRRAKCAHTDDPLHMQRAAPSIECARQEDGGGLVAHARPEAALRAYDRRGRGRRGAAEDAAGRS